MARIIHLAKYYSPDQGGIESVTQTLAKGASIAGYDVKVVCFANHAAAGEEVLDGINVLRSSKAGVIASQPIGFGYFFDCLRSSKPGDLVHLHMPNLLAAFCALLMPYKIRLLVHWHSDVVKKGLLGALTYPLQYLILCRADAIVATSPTYVSSSILLSRFKNKITVIPIGINGMFMPMAPIKLPEKLEIFIKERKIVLAVGRLVTYKGFENLVMAARHLEPKIAIVIVGDGPLGPSLESLIKDLCLEDRVILAGRLNENCLKKLFNISSVYCMSSINKAEAFGVVMLEAMSCGLPIVATSISGSGVPWVNKHGFSGLNVPTHDPRSLAEAINLILSSEDLRAQFSRGAKERFNNEFTAEISISRMLTLYSKLFAEI